MKHCPFFVPNTFVACSGCPGKPHGVSFYRQQFMLWIFVFLDVCVGVIVFVFVLCYPLSKIAHTWSYSLGFNCLSSPARMKVLCLFSVGDPKHPSGTQKKEHTHLCHISIATQGLSESLQGEIWPTGIYSLSYQVLETFFSKLRTSI